MLHTIVGCLCNHTSWPSWRKKEILKFMRTGLFAKLSSDQERRVVRQVSDDIGNIGGTIVQEKSAKAIFGIKWLTLTQ